jgi:hypothetical protein
MFEFALTAAKLIKKRAGHKKSGFRITEYRLIQYD